jgi:hypothetical protein
MTDSSIVCIGILTRVTNEVDYAALLKRKQRGAACHVPFSDLRNEYTFFVFEILSANVIFFRL